VDNVLGLARTGLIFTRIQEGAQSGGLTQPQPGQTEVGIPYMCRHAGFRWGVARGVRNSLAVQERRRRSCLGELLSGSCGSLLCFLLICIIVFTVPSVCYSVKLALSRPTGFLPVSFSFSSAPCGGRGGRVALLLLAAAKTKTRSFSVI